MSCSSERRLPVVVFYFAREFQVSFLLFVLMKPRLLSNFQDGKKRRESYFPFRNTTTPRETRVWRSAEKQRKELLQENTTTVKLWEIRAKDEASLAKAGERESLRAQISFPSLHTHTPDGERLWKRQESNKAARPFPTGVCLESPAGNLPLSLQVPPRLEFTLFLLSTHSGARTFLRQSGGEQ